MSTTTAVKKSVTIDREVLAGLQPDRTDNLSATVNEGLQLLSTVDAQQGLVSEWETEHGPFTSQELEPFIEEVVAALKESMRLRLRSQAVRAA